MSFKTAASVFVDEPTKLSSGAARRPSNTEPERVQLFGTVKSMHACRNQQLSHKRLYIDSESVSNSRDPGIRSGSYWTAAQGPLAKEVVPKLGFGLVLCG